MALFKKLHHAAAQIHLSSRHGDEHYFSSPDYFLSNEVITGYVQIKLPSGAELSHCQTTLKGVIKTTTEENNPGAFSKTWRTERLPFLGVSYEGKAREKNEQGVVRVPFRFNLSACQRLSALNSGLPPSLDSKLDGQKASGCQYEVTYTLIASASSTKGPFASATQKIFVRPVSPDALSDQRPDVPNEYHWAQISSTKQPKLQRLGSSTSTSSATTSTSSSGSGHRIELAGQEPEPFILDAEDGIPEGRTEVPFIVKLNHLNNEPKPTHCYVKAHLVTSTHMTPDGIKRIGSTREYVPDSGVHVTKSHINYEQDWVVPISRWIPSISPIPDPFSVARFLILFQIRDKIPPLPTFHTPILSRRYTIDIQLSFPDNPTDIYKLSLPVEMIHGEMDTSYYECQDASDASSGEAEASS